MGLALALGLSHGSARAPAAGRAGSTEAQEEDQLTAERLDALDSARARGAFGGAIGHAPVGAGNKHVAIAGEDDIGGLGHGGSFG